MKRTIDWHLKRWKSDTFRKPLLIRGARQVGKTFAVRVLGQNFENIVEINFEQMKEAKIVFEKDLIPERILLELSLLTGQTITPGKTLLFFDEIQECPEAIKSMRYFYEEKPEIHLIAAGSLLDFAIEKIGIPVGRVTSLQVYPLSFFEFLIAVKEKALAKEILSHKSDDPMPHVVHNKLLDLLGNYLSIGGMPEAVSRWIETKNPFECFKVHLELVDTYKQDFQKYAKRHQIPYLDTIFNEIPKFIGKEFKFSELNGNYKKRELEPCLELLILANIAHKVHPGSGNGIPIGVELSKYFKLIFIDIALSQTILGSDLSVWFLNPRTNLINKGEIIEAFVGQEILCYSMPYKKNLLYYWKAHKPSQAEVDYLLDYQEKIIPIETKSGDGRSLKSIHRYLELHPNCEKAIRFSAQNYSIFEKIDSRPIYAVASLTHQEQLDSLLALI